MKFIRFVFVACFLFVSILFNSCISFALSVTEIPKVRIEEFPENLELHISQECSGHTYFLQADANVNGDFVVLSHKEKYDKENNDVFSKKYIDVYNSEGTFCFEIIFTTEKNPTLRISGDSIYLFFYNNLLTIDIVTKEINYYEIPGNNLWEYSNREIMQTEEFSVGDWHYKCKMNFLLDFVELIRFNDNETTVLVDMPGAQLADFYSLFFGLAALVIIIVIKVVKNKCKKPQKT